MKNKKKLLAALAAAAVMAVGGGALGGCGHTHTYSDKWTSDATNHWHVATCDDLKEGDADYKSDVAAHRYGDDNECDVCHYKKVAPDPDPEEYTITLNANGGTLSTATLTTVNGKITLPTPTAPNGKEFNGWYTAAEGGTKVTNDKVYEEDTTIYAQYKNKEVGGEEETEYTITFDVGEDGTYDGETTLETVDGKIDLENDELPIPDAKTKDWQFLGWYDGETAVDILTHKFTADTTLTAKYGRKDGIWVGENMVKALSLNGNAANTQYWLGGERVDLKEGDEVSIYLNGALLEFLIDAKSTCIDKTVTDTKVTKATVTADASFVLYVNYWADSGNWQCEFIGSADVSAETDVLPEGCKGIEITVDEDKITLYLVAPDGTAINGENAHNYQIYSWDGVAVGNSGTEAFGGWNSNPTLNTAITSVCGIAKTTSFKLHWKGGESGAFSGLEVGNAYIVKLKTGNADCEVTKYTGTADILSPYVAPEEESAPLHYFIKGKTVTGWNTETTSKYELKETAEGSGEYSLTIYLTADDEFGFLSCEEEDGGEINPTQIGWFGTSTIWTATDNCVISGGSNFKSTEAGMYTITFNPKTNTMTFSYREATPEEIPSAPTVIALHYFIKGATVTGWNVSTAGNHELKETAEGSGVYSGTIQLTEGDQFGFISCNEYEDGIKAVQVEWYGKGTLTLTAEDNCVTEGNNLTAGAAGWYTFTLDPTAKTLNVTYSATDPAETPAE